jgi:hypothetical protein
MRRAPGDPLGALFHGPPRCAAAAAQPLFAAPAASFAASGRITLLIVPRTTVTRTFGAISASISSLSSLHLGDGADDAARR